MRFIKGKTYKLEWWDIHHDSSWSNPKDALLWADKVKPIVLTGQEFLGMNDNFYVFTSGRAGDGDTYDITLMPRKILHKAKLLR
jgi:hypothetical protein